MKNIRDKMIDAETRASKWLADGNEAEERGNKAKALRCFEKAQFWLDRYNKLAGLKQRRTDMMKIQSFEDFQATRKWTEDLEKATGYTIAAIPEAGETLHGFTYDDDTLYIIANGGGMAPALYTLYLMDETHVSADLEELERKLYNYPGPWETSRQANEAC